MSSTADALLRTVSDRPADDTPRLVYADWLDEAGDPARAEFVRAQVRLARLPASHPDRPALEDREHDLLAAHEVDWLGLASPGREPGEGLQEWHWDRGFVGEVAASPGWMLDHGDGLFAAHPVTRWRVLSDGTDDRADLARAARARWTSRLEALDLSGRATADIAPELLDLLVLPEFDRLRELDMTGLGDLDALPSVLRAAPLADRLAVLRCGPHGPLDPIALALALTRTRLTELSVPHTGLTAAGLVHLLAASCCAELESLDVRDNDLGPNGWQAFRDLPCRLRELDLSGTPLGAFALDRVLGCASTSGLRALELNRCGSAMANVRALAASPFWRQADDLRMHNGTIPARALEPLWEAAGPAELASLDLSDNYLYDAGVAELARADWSASLGWLALSRNYLTDDAARTIAGGRFTRLRTLHLSYNHPSWQEDADEDAAITEAGAIALAESPSLAALRLLVLTGTEVGPGGVEAVLNGPYWRLAGLGLGRCNLSEPAARVLGGSPRLARLAYLDLSTNYAFGGDVLRPLAESPHLSPLLELDIRGVPASDRVRQALQGRLGRRLSW